MIWLPTKKKVKKKDKREAVLQSYYFYKEMHINLSIKQSSATLPFKLRSQVRNILNSTNLRALL